MVKLLKMEMNALKKKLTVAVGEEIRQLSEVKKTYTKMEIAETAGISFPRITEYQYPEKYEKNISLVDLQRMIIAGFITVDGLKAEVDLNEKETKFLETYRVYEQPGLHAVLNDIVNLGGNPVLLLSKIAKQLKTEQEKEKKTRKSKLKAK